jgi:hypothetical protein
LPVRRAFFVFKKSLWISYGRNIFSRISNS